MAWTRSHSFVVEILLLCTWCLHSHPETHVMFWIWRKFGTIQKTNYFLYPIKKRHLPITWFTKGSNCCIKSHQNAGSEVFANVETKPTLLTGWRGGGGHATFPIDQASALQRVNLCLALGCSALASDKDHKQNSIVVYWLALRDPGTCSKMTDIIPCQLLDTHSVSHSH